MVFLAKQNLNFQLACCKLYDFDSFKQVYIESVGSMCGIGQCWAKMSGPSYDHIWNTNQYKPFSHILIV